MRRIAQGSSSQRLAQAGPHWPKSHRDPEADNRAPCVTAFYGFVEIGVFVEQYPEPVPKAPRQPSYDSISDWPRNLGACAFMEYVRMVELDDPIEHASGTIPKAVFSVGTGPYVPWKNHRFRSNGVGMARVVRAN